MTDCWAVVLAAGRGTRMGVSYPKVLAKIKGRPMINWCLDSLQAAGLERVLVVVGYGANRVRQAINQAGYQVDFAYQSAQLGTGHAVMAALPEIQVNTSTILVTYGDMPFIPSATFRRLVKQQQTTKAVIVLTSVHFDDPLGPAFGRIKRDASGRIVKIVEQKVCSPEELKITECNVGAVIYRASWLRRYLPTVKPSSTGEYYLTDLVELAASQGELVEAVSVDQPWLAHGINTLEHLREAEKLLTQN